MAGIVIILAVIVVLVFVAVSSNLWAFVLVILYAILLLLSANDAICILAASPPLAFLAVIVGSFTKEDGGVFTDDTIVDLPPTVLLLDVQFLLEANTFSSLLFATFEIVVRHILVRWFCGRR